MPVITLERLNNFMSNPQWTPEQRDAIADIIDGVEGNLEGSLSGAYITLRPMFECAPILTSGLLATRQPVHTVQEIDGVAVDETHPLALPWVLTENRLRNTSVTAYPPGVLTLPATSSAWGAANVPRVENVGQATVRYLGGWGSERTLVLAMLNKCAAITRNRFDDTISTSGTDSENVPRPARETWSKEELAPLGIYRNIGAYR